MSVARSVGEFDRVGRGCDVQIVPVRMALFREVELVVSLAPYPGSGFAFLTETAYFILDGRNGDRSCLWRQVE